MEGKMITELDMEMVSYEDVEEVVNFETNESNNDDQEIDLSEFTPSVCSQQGRSVEKAGVLSVVYSKNGMRVVLSRELMERLNYPKTVQIGFSDHQIAIAEHLGDHYTSYPMSKSGAKSIIYRSELVKQIAERYRLDFRNRTSITLTEVKYKVNGGTTIAFINVNQ